MNRICLVVCHFGPFPPWWSIYLATCARNRDLDLLIVTDRKSPVDPPENARVRTLTLPELERHIAIRLGCRAAVSSPYKLCDFRPAFGVIFAEDLDGYEFWGHSDTDVILGNVTGVLTSRALDECDVIDTREEYLTGHFTLYRNTPQVNRLYERSPDARRVFESPTHFCFDECNFRWFELLGTAKSIFDTSAEIQSMTHVVRAAERRGTIRLHMRTVVREVHASREALWMRWDDGELRDLASGREYMCLHFHSIRHGRFSIPNWSSPPRRFYISRSGIFSLRGWKGVTSLTRLMARQVQVGSVAASRRLLPRGRGTRDQS